MRGDERSPDRAKLNAATDPNRRPRQRSNRRVPMVGRLAMGIRNPLQPSYDKRAIQQARSTRRELGEDDPIPNPLCMQTLRQASSSRPRTQDRATTSCPRTDRYPNPLEQTYRPSLRPEGSKAHGPQWLWCRRARRPTRSPRWWWWRRQAAEGDAPSVSPIPMQTARSATSAATPSVRKWRPGWQGWWAGRQPGWSQAAEAVAEVAAVAAVVAVR